MSKNRSKRIHAIPKSKKRKSARKPFGCKLAPKERKRRLATLIAIRQGEPIRGNSIGEGALMPIIFPFIGTEERAHRAQARYLAIYNRFQLWDKKTTRIDMAPYIVRDDYGRPAITLMGRVVDVRYSDHWDKRARVSAICLMEPHVVVDEGDTVAAASHIWLFAKDLEVEDTTEKDCPDCFLGDLLMVVVELDTYDSNGRGETVTRLGARHWTPIARVFNYFDYSRHRMLEERALLTANVYSFEQGHPVFALRTSISEQISSLKELDEYRNPCVRAKVF